MKITSVFLYNKRKLSDKYIIKTKDIFTKFFEDICLTIFVMINVIISINLLIDINLPKKIINLSTNYVMKDNNDFNIKDIYPVFNKKSYIMKDLPKEDNKPKENEEIKEVKKAFDREDSNINFNNIEYTITKTKSGNNEKIKINNTYISNNSTLKDLDFKKLIDQNIILTKKNDKIFLYSTHASETYTDPNIVYSGTFRSKDPNYNVLHVGKNLTKYLNDDNIQVKHNTTGHDYYSYNSSYSNSYITLKNELKNNSYAILIDIHRDATGSPTFAPKVTIDGEKTAQIMFVMGVGTQRKRNPYASSNLSLAIKIQLLADKLYPGLFRPMIIRDSNYNQNLTKGTLLLEVGGNGNTLEEVNNAVICFSNLLKQIYIN